MGDSGGASEGRLLCALSGSVALRSLVAFEKWSIEGWGAQGYRQCASDVRSVFAAHYIRSLLRCGLGFDCAGVWLGFSVGSVLERGWCYDMRRVHRMAGARVASLLLHSVGIRVATKRSIFCRLPWSHQRVSSCSLQLVAFAGCVCVCACFVRVSIVAIVA